MLIPFSISPKTTTFFPTFSASKYSFNFRCNLISTRLMSTTVISDPMVMPPADSPASITAQTTELQFAKCDCCGLTEECTPAYITTIRERYYGNWICGLCGEAVKDEIVRSERLISTKEAVTRHMNFCRSPEPPRNPSVDLIVAMRRILRRSLDSPIRSMPNSPVRNTDNVRRSRSYTDLQEILNTEK